MSAKSYNRAILLIGILLIVCIQGISQTKLGNVSISSHSAIGMALYPKENRAYFLSNVISSWNQNTSYIYIINTSDYKVLDTITIAPYFPGSIVVNPLTNNLYIGSSSQQYRAGSGGPGSPAKNSNIVKKYSISNDFNSISFDNNLVLPHNGSSGDVGLDIKRNLVYTSNQYWWNLYGINPESGRIVSNQTVNYGSSCISILRDNKVDTTTGAVYLASPATQGVQVFYPNTNSPQTIGIPGCPFDIEVNSKANRVYVGSKNTLTVLETNDNNKIQVSIGINGLRDIGANRMNNIVYVIAGQFGGKGTLYTIDGRDNSIIKKEAINLGNTVKGVAVDEHNNIVYVYGNGGFSAYQGYVRPPEFGAYTLSDVTNHSARITVPFLHSGDSLGVCYNLTGQPIVSSADTNMTVLLLGNSIGTLSGTMKNLIEDTTYYLRAFAYYQGKFHYGHEIVLHTKATPEIISLSPHNKVPVGGTLSVCAKNFNSGPIENNKVVFTGGVEAPILKVHEDTLSVKVPKGAKSGPITLISNGLKSLPSVETFQLLQVPKITSFGSNEVKPGDVLTIYGTGFNDIPEENRVFFAGGVSNTAISATNVSSDTDEESDECCSKITVEVPQYAQNGKVHIVSGLQGNEIAGPGSEDSFVSLPVVKQMCYSSIPNKRVKSGSNCCQMFTQSCSDPKTWRWVFINQGNIYWTGTNVGTCHRESMCVVGTTKAEIDGTKKGPIFGACKVFSDGPRKINQITIDYKNQTAIYHGEDMYGNPKQRAIPWSELNYAGSYSGRGCDK